ncbi:lantibiotic dehydratase [Sphaerisporangium sp. B11E5]|uniref:lantibiotic dehydratase n=1 Tax=Sphaerisporangium sp. B11E5 TaxID=3153563 RepID=UPI00325F1687
MTAFRMLDTFVLRRAGFPFGLLSGLDCPRTAAALRDAHLCRDRAEAARAGLLETVIPAEVERLRADGGDRAALRALSRLRARVGRRAAAELPAGPWSAELVSGHREWTGALDDAAAHTARAGDLLESEGPEAAAALRTATGRTDVREAVFLLSPDFLESLVRRDERPGEASRTARDRAMERREYAYLQRLGAKNETTSFFGPVCFGRVDPEADSIECGPETPSGVASRETFTTFWAAVAWGRAAAAVPSIRKLLPPRRLPVAIIEETGVARIPGRDPVRLDPIDLALVRAADGVRTAAELGIATGTGAEEAERRVSVLERTLLLRRDLEPSSTTVYPLRDVVGRLPDVPAAARFRDAADDLEALLRRFAEEPGVAERTKILAAAEELFTSVTGVPARRNQGRTYADRFILFEDCHADGQPVRWPAATARRMERALDPVLRLGLTGGRLQHEGLRAIAAEVLSRHGGSLPFLDFADEFAAHLATGAFEPVLDTWGRWRTALLDRFLAVSDGRHAYLPPEAVADLTNPPEGTFFVSPDVMLQAGDAPLVLGEIHPYVFAWGLQAHFAPDPGELARDVAPALGVWGGLERAATVLHRRQHKGLVGATYPGTFIEVTGRSGAPAGRHVAAGDLRAVLRDGRPELIGPNGPLSLYIGEDDHPHLRVFAPVPVDFPRLRAGEHTPRLVLGDLVVQRERWDLPTGTLPGITNATTRLDLFAAVTTERERRGWPRHVFAVSPTETKPICLDLDAPPAQEHLRTLAATAPLSLSEMLPTPESLWLHRSTGPHTSEFRIALTTHTGPTP